MTSGYDPNELMASFKRVAERSQHVLQEYVQRQGEATPANPDPLNIGEAFAELFAHMLADPSKLAETQMALWQQYMLLWQQTAERMMGGSATSVIEPEPKDKRFKDPAWQDNVLFDYIKQSYLLAARALQKSVHEVEGLDKHTAQKVDFYTRQFVDAMAPSNFLLTNPEVLRTTVESGGENLIKGFENLLTDLERGGGKLKISMTDEKAFTLGKNIATTPGKIIYQNDLMQLIQYAPLTDKVYKVPLLIIPAWINKYYIMDLKPENSMVRWLLEQGYTVFVISWVNPSAKLAQKTFDDYLKEGPLAALDAIEKATGEKTVNAIGYCLGGTLLSITLAYLAAKKQASRIGAATYLTTLVDFANAGELSVFIDEEQLQSLQERMSEKGYLPGEDMAATFNMLRANDLIWSFVVNNYLLGREPFPFDLLYWNADSTRMPATMHLFYLRNMYQKNLLSKPKGIKVAGVPIDLTRIKTPAFILATKEDHIAPWKSAYAATQLYKGPITFMLAASGHIAGVVNPPANKKYSHWENKNLPKSPDAWLAKAKEIPGSWWPAGEKWLRKYSGAKVAARKPGAGKLKPIENAPGSYVKVRS